MDSNGLKLTFKVGSSCASSQDEASRNGRDQVDVKLKRKALESPEDDFDEFVALLERIQYMKSNHMNSSISELDLTSMREKSTVNGISLWKPSFEWEDFSLSAPKDAHSAAQHDIPISLNTEMNLREEQSVQTGNHLDKPAEGFDLNVEASSEDIISAGF